MWVENCKHGENQRTPARVEDRLLHTRSISATLPFTYRAKPTSSRPPYFLILDRRRQEDARKDMLAFVQYQDTWDVKNKWEQLSQKRITHGAVQRRVNEGLHLYHSGIEDRRLRLRSLLEEEEKLFIAEMECKEETTIERQAKMRERAKFLREKREEERQQLVSEKLEQQFREQTEELRTEMSRRHTEQVFSERMAQLNLKEQILQKQKEEEQFFADLWEKDRQAKAEREEQQVQKRAERMRETLDVLQVQKAAAEAQRLEEKRLKEEEARLTDEQRNMLFLEKERTELEKLQKQQKTRNLLDESLRLKMKRLNKEAQEELALDMKILEQLLGEEQDDTEERRRRKIELRNEQQWYRQYLAEQLEEQKREEREMDQLLDAELKKSWAKRDEQWSLEREARNRLMKEVMDTRILQIQEKLDKNKAEQMQLAKDKETLYKALEEQNALEDERKASQRKANKEYQDHLLSQMAHIQNLRETEKMEQWREYEDGQTEENKFQDKLAEILTRPYMKLVHIHPFRRSRISSPKNWLPS
uniref:Cilia- and flagella-associated protein 53 n=1 Tax=Erpetoichthys calabaricus TaxID=27687 RepID=A0A8C4X576_ERPCA